MLRNLRYLSTLATMTRARPKDAIIAIIGATGTGKSQVYE